MLMPPSLQDWLPQDHLAWFVLAAVEEMDLAAFYGAYRGDGVGRPAHDPGVMVALLLYAYSRGQRSSRRIERACVEDVAHRVICVNEAPDHTTIARFRQRHEDAIAGLFGDVLRLCADAGLAGVGLVAVDGTKVHADASHHANRDYEQIAARSLPRPTLSTPRRTSSSVTGAATSCRLSCRRAAGARSGCARAASALRPSAPPTPSRSRPHGPSG